MPVALKLSNEDARALVKLIQRHDDGRFEAMAKGILSSLDEQAPAPFRKVIERIVGYGAGYEVLECGHSVALSVTDNRIHPPEAERRRCKRCLKEQKETANV